MIKVHFTDYFGIEPSILDDYGAFNVSLINDLPLFIDPFLLFNSDKEEYQELHEEIIRYLQFLREKSEGGAIGRGLLRAWFTFPEVKQNWLGYSLVGNEGSGLGMHFAKVLRRNLAEVFVNFGEETVTRSSHLEKLCLIEDGVGRDNISDFTTNLIKSYLLQYTENFAVNFLEDDARRRFVVEKAEFRYSTETWLPKAFELPAIDDDYVLLTPKDLLTKDEVWINRNEMLGDFHDIVASIPNEQLRAQLNNYFIRAVPENATKGEERDAIVRAIERHPGYIEYYIKVKEDAGERATAVSDLRVAETQSLFVEQLRGFVSRVEDTDFYSLSGATKAECRKRAFYLKDVIENKGGWRVFYVDGEPIRRESDLHILFRLTWFGTPSDVSHEVDDGRGPADFKISRGRWDKTIIEFKLASNTKLKQNLEKQTEIYQAASDAEAGLKVILYFDGDQLERVNNILRDLGLQGSPDIILIDGGPKLSASRVH